MDRTANAYSVGSAPSVVASAAPSAADQQRWRAIVILTHLLEVVQTRAWFLAVLTFSYTSQNL